MKRLAKGLLCLFLVGMATSCDFDTVKQQYLNQEATAFTDPNETQTGNEQNNSGSSEEDDGIGE